MRKRFTKREWREGQGQDAGDSVRVRRDWGWQLVKKPSVQDVVDKIMKDVFGASHAEMQAMIAGPAERPTLQ